LVAPQLLLLAGLLAVQPVEGWDEGEDALAAADAADRLDPINEALGLDRERIRRVFDDPSLPNLDIGDLERELRAEERLQLRRRRAISVELSAALWSQGTLESLSASGFADAGRAGFLVLLTVSVLPEAWLQPLPATSALSPRDEERRRRRCMAIAQRQNEAQELLERLAEERLRALSCESSALEEAP
jgi:hypothetical protein